MNCRLRYLELAELAEVPRYLSYVVGLPRAKILGRGLMYLELAEVPRYLS